MRRYRVRVAHRSRRRAGFGCRVKPLGRHLPFAGMMRRWDWEQDGLRKKADEALRDAGQQVTAMAFLTTEPNSIVAPIHPKAMPVVLHTEEQFEIWLTGTAEEAVSLQKPLPMNFWSWHLRAGNRTRDEPSIEHACSTGNPQYSLFSSCGKVLVTPLPLTYQTPRRVSLPFFGWPAIFCAELTACDGRALSSLRDFDLGRR